MLVYACNNMCAVTRICLALILAQPLVAVFGQQPLGCLWVQTPKTLDIDPETLITDA